MKEIECLHNRYKNIIKEIKVKENMARGRKGIKDKENAIKEHVGPVANSGTRHIIDRPPEDKQEDIKEAGERKHGELGIKAKAMFGPPNGTAGPIKMTRCNSDIKPHQKSNQKTKTINKFR